MKKRHILYAFLAFALAVPVSIGVAATVSMLLRMVEQEKIEAHNG